MALRSTRSCAWIAVVEAHHASIRSSFQLRIVGVTAITEPGFGRVFSIAERSKLQFSPCAKAGAPQSLG
ncbi:MAG: hypothetical protein DRH23_07805 [Deltaproteobacteria bacterium]|nr:MAG: hypothetical protein DRH23_07805 [Deltaproteobacteria bacterium]